MTTKNEKVFVDPDGRQVPAKYVSAFDKQRDKTARQIAKLWQDEEARLAALKAKTNELIETLVRDAALTHGITLGGQQGYIQFRSFDGRIVVRSENVKQTEFNETLAIVQQLISEAIQEMAHGVDATGKNRSASDLKAIADSAFRPRGKNGRLDMQRIRDLAKIKVSHPKWKKAVSLIQECEAVTGHKRYIRVSTQAGATATPVPILLDISRIPEVQP